MENSPISFKFLTFNQEQKVHTWKKTVKQMSWLKSHDLQMIIYFWMYGNKMPVERQKVTI